MALRIGILGAGQIARTHLRSLAGLAAVQVAGIHDRDLDRARELSSSYGVERVYNTWAELRDDPTVDLIAVFLPHDLHASYTVEALGAGKHVVCEKPLAPTVAECRQMLDAAAKAGVHLFPVHNRVYDPASERLRDLVQEGAIGDVFLVQTVGFEGPKTVSVRPWLATKSGGGGVLLAQAVHPAYLLRWLLGDVTRVSCLFGKRRRVEMTAEDTAVATLQFASGALGEMTATFGIAHGPFDHAVILHGSDGYLELRSNPAREPGRPHLVRGYAPKLFGDAEWHEVDVPLADGWQSGFRRLWEDYAAAIANGTTPRVTGLDGLRAVEIVEAAYRSERAGRAVDLPLAESPA